MKRSIALTLTVIIFVAIAFCFLRPADSQIGYPRPILESGTRLELSGDTEYFEYAEVLEVDYISGTIDILLPPVEPYVLLIGSRVGPYGMSGEEEGYIEKLVDGEWVYLRETGRGGSETMEGGPPRHFSLTYDPEAVHTKYGQCYRVYAMPILFDPGAYRFTLHFRQIEGADKEVGDVITISFVVTVPDEPTGKRFDIYPHSWGPILIRSNDGSPAPYPVLGDPIEITHIETGQVFTGHVDPWAIMLPYTDYDVPKEEWTYRAFSFSATSRLPLGEYRISLEFSENPDGSGERYPCTYTTTLGS